MHNLTFATAPWVLHQGQNRSIVESKRSWTSRDTFSCGRAVCKRAPLRWPKLNQTVRCFRTTGESGEEEDVFGEDSNGDENNGNEIVLLTDADTGRMLPCVVEHKISVMNATYLVCSPQDEVVSFAKSRGDDDNVFVEDDDLVDVLFPAAASALANDNVILKRSAFVLTIDGDDSEFRLDDELDPCVDDEYDEGGNYSALSEAPSAPNFMTREDVEFASIITEFRYNNEKYYVIKPDDPVLFVARRDQEGGLLVLDREEVGYISPILEAEIAALDVEPN